MRTRSDCYFRTTGQNSDTAVGFNDSDFLYGTNILATGGPLPASVATFSLRMRKNCYLLASGKHMTSPLDSAT